MLLRVIFGAALLAILGSMLFGFHRAGHFRAWMGGTPPPKPIVFDNGSVRDTLPAPASAPSTVTVLSPPGVLRKCVRGDRVTYSNLTCPEGFRERTVSDDKLTVVPAPATAKPPAKTATAETRPGRALQGALDVQADEKLRQRMIDRAVDAEAK
jgi:hypothetical protein